MELLTFKSESAQKSFSLFYDLWEKGIKELNLEDLKKEIGIFFGMNHTTMHNYKSSFISLHFVEIQERKKQQDGTTIEIFKINYDKIQKYFERVYAHEQRTASFY